MSEPIAADVLAMAQQWDRWPARVADIDAPVRVLIERDHTEALVEHIRREMGDEWAAIAANAIDLVDSAQYKTWPARVARPRDTFADLIERDHAEALAINAARDLPPADGQCGCSNPWCQV